MHKYRKNRFFLIKTSSVIIFSLFSELINFRKRDINPLVKKLFSFLLHSTLIIVLLFTIQLVKYRKEKKSVFANHFCGFVLEVDGFYWVTSYCLVLLLDM